MRKKTQIEEFDEYLATELAKRAARKSRPPAVATNFLVNSVRDMLISIVVLVAFVLGYNAISTPKPEQTDILAPYKAEVELFTRTAQFYVTSEDVTKIGEKVTVSEVIDGDTIKVKRADGTEVSVRYIGIDTPEIKHKEGDTDEPFGASATLANVVLLSGKTVYLVKDVSEVDRYGRLLRYVYLPDGILVNQALIRLGYATVYTFPPDVSLQTTLVSAQTRAREEKRNLWKE